MADPADLIERSEELARIGAALALARTGEGVLALVTGPAGIGKTALLAAARARARSDGFTTLNAVGTELECAFPFGVARQLYRRSKGPSSPNRSVDPVAAVLTSGGEGTDVSFQVLDDLYWLVADLALQTPLLIVVDDVQWSDEPSLRHLAYLCRRFEGLPVAVLAAERSGTSFRPALEDLRDLASVRVAPAPLGLKGVGELIDRTLGDAPTPDFASACLNETGGLPLYLAELLRSAREQGIRPDDAAIEALERVDAADLARHVWRRIEAIGPGAGDVGGAASVLGERASPGRISALVERPAVVVGELLDGLIAQGILESRDPPRFAHPVVRAAVESRLSSGQLDVWHRAAAHLLDREGADVREVAGHLMRCQPEQDPWVVRRLREFAGAVSSRGAPESAAAALRRALEEPPPDELRVPLLRELARAEDAAGEPAAALGHLDHALRLTVDSRERTELAIDRFHVLSLVNRFEEAVAALDDGLAALNGSDPELEQRIDGELITAALVSRDARQRGFERLARYEGRVPDGPAAAAVLTAMTLGAAFTVQPAAEVARLAERALRAGGVGNGRIGTAWAQASWALVFADRPGLALELAQQERTTVRREGHRREILMLESTLAFAALRMGDIPTAVSYAQAALAITDPGRHECWGHGVNALALIEAGDLDAVERALAATSPVHWEDGTPGSFSLFYARAQLRVLQGRFDEAADDLDEMRRRAEALGGEGLRTFEDLWRIVAVTLEHRRGNVERARALVAEELAFARAFGAVGYVGQVLRTAALVGEPDQELGGLRESLALLEPSPYRLEHARSLVELGAALRRRDQRVAAREPLAEGLDLAYRCGAGLVVGQALDELRASGARPRRAVRSGAGALTPRETRVALLAARGRTNREIAQELYVTLKTVEGTLGRVYAKLDISGRGAREALPDALGPLRQA